MTATAKEDDKGLASLKGCVCTAAMGTQANNHTMTTNAIAECVGRVHGNEMQQLVLSGKKSNQLNQPTQMTLMQPTNAKPSGGNNATCF